MGYTNLLKASSTPMRLAILCWMFFLFLINPGASFQVDSLEQRLETVQGVERVELLNELFRKYFNNDPVLALNYATEALELAKQLNYAKGLAASYNDIGVIFRLRGQFDNALENYLEAYRNYSSIEEREGLAKVLNNIGTIYSLKAEYDKALDNYLESYEILQSLGSTEKIIGSLNNIGNVYREQEEYEQEEYEQEEYEQEEYEQEEYEQEEYEQEEYEQALAFYEQALELQKTLDKESQFDPLTNIGNIHFSQRNYDRALEVYFESLEIERDHKNLYGQAYALSNIGVTYHQKKEFKMSISFQTQALNLARTIEDNVLLSKIYKALADAYYANDDLLMAYNSLLLYISGRDTLFNQESDKKINQLEMEFEFLKEEAQRNLLQRDQNITRLKDRNQQVTVLLIILASILGVSLIIGLYRNFYGR